MAQEDHTDKGKLLAVVATVFPLGGILLTLAGLTLTVTVVGLTAALPFLILFSPVFAPAAAVLGTALAALLAAGAMGLAAVRALSWLLGYLREALAPERLRRSALEAAEVAGESTKELGERIRTRAINLVD